MRLEFTDNTRIRFIDVQPHGAGIYTQHLDLECSFCVTAEFRVVVLAPVFDGTLEFFGVRIDDLTELDS